ncbi:18598_t:CDS:1, partial [Racocetra persica]
LNAITSSTFLSFDNDNSFNLENITNITLPPLPIKTRWNSLFNFIIWLSPYIDFFPFFIANEIILAGDKASKALKDLNTSFQDNAH